MTNRLQEIYIWPIKHWPPNPYYLKNKLKIINAKQGGACAQMGTLRDTAISFYSLGNEIRSGERGVRQQSL